MTELRTIARAEISDGTAVPMPRHLVQTHGGVRETTLCGRPWDRLGVRPNGDLCEGCGDEFARRHGGRHPEDRKA